jgi:hypothetical protein
MDTLSALEHKIEILFLYSREAVVNAHFFVPMSMRPHRPQRRKEWDERHPSGPNPLEKP